jgi:simple sugar transport system ATP-binding protein
MGLPAVTISDVTKVYGATVALERVSFSVEQGTIHALLGRNGAGKSTLVSLLAGLDKPTSGAISFHDRIGKVGTVFQHSMLVPSLSVAENMFLGNLPVHRRGVDWAQIRRQTRQRLDEWGLNISEDASVSDLTVSQRQIVEIIRELSRGSSFIILDEPTARIQGAEITELHEKVLKARERGTTFIYISHHLPEVMQICDFATVLRDGKFVATRKVADVQAGVFVADMVGADLPVTEAPARALNKTGRPVVMLDQIESGDLQVQGLALHHGEMLGIAGIQGSGKELLGAILSGNQACDRLVGSLQGKALDFKTPREAIEQGIGYVPPDRHHHGLVLSLPVGENVTMSVLHRLAGAFGLINTQRTAAVAQRLIARVGIKASSPGQLVSELSGGNQQKAVLAKALSTDPKLLILVNPTTGVDIASKANIYGIIDAARSTGMAVILISDEVEELRLCDRILVMRDGRIRAEFSGAWRGDELVATIEGVEK